MGDAETQRIRTLLSERDAAIAASDADGALATTADGTVSYALDPPLAQVHDHDRAADALRAWFATWRDGVTTTLHEPIITISGDLALAYGLSNMRGDKVDEGATDVWYRSTIALQRGPDGWRIIHEHHSFPMAMDGSGRAMTDLKPE